MKSLLTFLAFNVVLLICCYEKKCAGSMNEPSYIEPVNMKNVLTMAFDTDENSGRKWDSRMHILITNGFVKGYYCVEDMRQHINVVGAVNDRNEMILIESENGKIKRTFQGKYRKKGNGMLLLSGIWKCANNSMLSGFSDNKILQDSDHPHTFSLISKKQ